MANTVYAGYVPSTGILTINEVFADTGGAPCNINVSQDGSGNPVIAAGDSNTTINNVASFPVGPTPGLVSVNIVMLNNDNTIVVQGFKGGSAALQVGSGSGATHLQLQGGCTFAGGFRYSGHGGSFTCTILDKIGS